MNRYLNLLITLFALLSPGIALAQSSEAEYQAKLKALQDTMQQLQKELSAVKSDRDTLQNDLQKSEENIGELLKKIDRIKGDLSQQKKQLAQLTQQRLELRQQQKSQQSQISQHISAAYRLGQQSQLKLVLNQEHPDQVARMMKYYDYFIDARADDINNYLEVIAQLDNIEPEINRKAQSLEASKTSLQQQAAALSDSQKARQQTLKRLNQSIASKDDELKQKAKDRQRLQRLLDEVTQALADLTLPGGNDKPFQKLQGNLLWPAKGKILQRYGSSRGDGGLNWEGVLIGAADGNNVRAVHHGRVVFSDYLKGHGLLMIIDHGDGYMSLYAHNQSLLKESGDWVNAQDIIARVGNSGGLSQSALYFEIRYQGKPVDPSRWCRS